ncbi:MAG: acetyl-CoA carboxylase, carboxyltransferase subunit beta [Candidatus Puniceispirillales bacterium]|nr:acetyl-CoA carboxylase, carboxyltransferase subunit beta [Pseudomonadota bacterium]
MNWLSRTVLPKIKALVSPEPAKETLWIKCGACSQMIFHRECEENWNTCNACGFHMPLSPEARSRLLCDADSITSISVATADKDPLGFRDRKRYSDRLKEARTKTGDDDAISVTAGRINGNPVVIATFNFAFMGGSMGQTVGNGIVKAAREAIQRKAALIIVPSSGGARMQEGILSLMQLPRSIVAIEELREANLPYIVLLAHPTTGGVTASFAMLGDIQIAEPGAIIGFAGRRVIEETVREKLPEGFQSAEYLQEHGMVDMVLPRQDQRRIIGSLLDMLMTNQTASAAE